MSSLTCKKPRSSTIHSFEDIHPCWYTCTRRCATSAISAESADAAEGAGVAEDTVRKLDHRGRRGRGKASKRSWNVSSGAPSKALEAANVIQGIKGRVNPLRALSHRGRERHGSPRAPGLVRAPRILRATGPLRAPRDLCLIPVDWNRFRFRSQKLELIPIPAEHDMVMWNRFQFRF